VIYSNMYAFKHLLRNVVLGPALQRLGLTHDHDPPAIFGCIFSLLFTPSRSVAHLIQTALAPLHPAAHLACMQLRTGRSAADSAWLDDSFGDEQVEKAWMQFISHNFSQTRSWFFVSADSSRTRTLALNLLSDRVLQVTGPVYHIDRGSRIRAAAAFPRAVTEWYILGLCDELLFSSGFGQSASWRTRVPVRYQCINSTIERVV